MLGEQEKSNIALSAAKIASKIMKDAENNTINSDKTLTALISFYSFLAIKNNETDNAEAIILEILDKVYQKVSVEGKSNLINAEITKENIKNKILEANKKEVLEILKAKKEFLGSMQVKLLLPITIASIESGKEFLDEETKELIKETHSSLFKKFLTMGFSLADTKDFFKAYLNVVKKRISSKNKDVLVELELLPDTFLAKMEEKFKDEIQVFTLGKKLDKELFKTVKTKLNNKEEDKNISIDDFEL